MNIIGKNSLRQGLKIPLIIKISEDYEQKGEDDPSILFLHIIVYPGRYRPDKDLSMELTSRIGKVVHHEMNSYDR